jgi:translocator protein
MAGQGPVQGQQGQQGLVGPAPTAPAPGPWWRTNVAARAASAALVVALLGGLATDIGPWYLGLKRPPWQPPDILFGPVWTAIYALCVWSFCRVWLALGAGPTHGQCNAPDAPALQARANAAARSRRWLLGLWGLNAVLNLLWSLLFFKLRRPDWALVEVPLLWASVLVLALLSARRDRLAAWLLVPYLAWVLFAAVLNRAVAALNGPFG